MAAEYIASLKSVQETGAGAREQTLGKTMGG